MLFHCFTVNDIDIWYIIRNQNVQTNRQGTKLNYQITSGSVAFT